MELKKSKVLVVGGAGFIGSFVVAELLKEDISEVIIYDNFARGKKRIFKRIIKRCEMQNISNWW